MMEKLNMERLSDFLSITQLMSKEAGNDVDSLVCKLCESYP